MRELKTTLITTTTILLVFFLFVKFIGPIPFSVNSINTQKSNLFTVSGTGEATGIPDTAQISIGVTKTAATVGATQDQANSTVNKIINDLKAIGVKEKDIKTTNYSVNPNYDYSRGGTQTITGYTTTQNLSIKVSPVDFANKAIDAATANGANLVSGITFTLNEEVKKDLQEKARTDAIKEAKEKAESLAKASGIKLGKIVDVQESAGYEPRPMFVATLDSSAKGAETQLEPGENKVSINITLSYETY